MIKSRSGIPRYLQLADELRALIESGEAKPGELLPSEHELSKQHGVSRGTVVRAIEILLDEGLAQRRQGLGTFVARPSLRRQPGILASFSASVQEQGRVSTQQLLGVKNLSRAQAMQFGCGTAALQLQRLRVVDGVPWAIHKCLVPEDIAATVPALNGSNRALLSAPNFSLYAALEEAGHVVASAEEILRARVATAQEAATLQIPKTSALMTVHRKSYDEDGRLLELVEADYVGELYTYEARLLRPRSLSVVRRRVSR